MFLYEFWNRDKKSIPTFKLAIAKIFVFIFEAQNTLPIDDFFELKESSSAFTSLYYAIINEFKQVCIYFIKN